DEAVPLIALALEIEYGAVFEILPTGSALIVRAGSGWKPGVVGQTTVAAGVDSEVGYTLLSSTPVIVADLRADTRFQGPPFLLDHDVISGMSVLIHGQRRPFGVLGVYTTRERAFSE